MGNAQAQAGMRELCLSGIGAHHRRMGSGTCKFFLVICSIAYVYITNVWSLTFEKKIDTLSVCLMKPNTTYISALQHNLGRAATRPSDAAADLLWCRGLQLIR
jgi:hypothetical protein